MTGGVLTPWPNPGVVTLVTSTRLPHIYCWRHFLPPSGASIDWFDSRWWWRYWWPAPGPVFDCDELTLQWKKRPGLWRRWNLFGWRWNWAAYADDIPLTLRELTHWRRYRPLRAAIAQWRRPSQLMLTSPWRRWPGGPVAPYGDLTGGDWPLLFVDILVCWYPHSRWWPQFPHWPVLCWWYCCWWCDPIGIYDYESPRAFDVACWWHLFIRARLGLVTGDLFGPRPSRLRHSVFDTGAPFGMLTTRWRWLLLMIPRYLGWLMLLCYLLVKILLIWWPVGQPCCWWLTFLTDLVMPLVLWPDDVIVDCWCHTTYIVVVTTTVFPVGCWLLVLFVRIVDYSIYDIVGIIVVIWRYYYFSIDCIYLFVDKFILHWLRLLVMVLVFFPLYYLFIDDIGIVIVIVPVIVLFITTYCVLLILLVIHLRYIVVWSGRCCCPRYLQYIWYWWHGIHLWPHLMTFTLLVLLLLIQSI